MAFCLRKVSGEAGRTRMFVALAGLMALARSIIERLTGYPREEGLLLIGIGSSSSADSSDVASSLVSSILVTLLALLWKNIVFISTSESSIVS